MRYIKATVTNLRSLGCVLPLLTLLGRAILNGKISVDPVRPRHSSTTEGEGVRIRFNNGYLDIDNKGNISLLSPSSVAIKTKLLFLVSEKDPTCQDSFIADTIQADAENQLEYHVDANEISLL